MFRRSQRGPTFDEAMLDARNASAGRQFLARGIASVGDQRSASVVATAGARGVDRVQTPRGSVPVTPDSLAVRRMERYVVDAMTLEEFLRYGENFLDDRDAVRAYARGDVQLIFDAMDVDGDGRLTVAEYRAYLRACGADDAIADAFFAHADLDEDGRVTRDELSHAVQEFLLSENPDAAGNYLFGPILPDPG